MFTQESTYLYVLTATLVIATAAVLLLLGRALYDFQIFW
jgi:hypothetical protein